MKLGIMQPYFFPYVGYFQLMDSVDEWVIFDEIQFINKGWCNRNRILKPFGDWQYITVPLKKHHRETKISEVIIKDNWKNILGKLTVYRKAPYYHETMDLIERCFDIDSLRLSDILDRSLRLTAKHLGITTAIYRQPKVENVAHAGQWALRISEKMGADEYVNPIAGVPLFDKNEFKNAGIGLSYHESNLFEYDQGREFIPGLSIIDVLMFTGGIK